MSDQEGRHYPGCPMMRPAAEVGYSSSCECRAEARVRQQLAVEVGLMPGAPPAMQALVSRQEVITLVTGPTLNRGAR